VAVSCKIFCKAVAYNAGPDNNDIHKRSCAKYMRAFSA
jgi:hypothetical protein